MGLEIDRERFEEDDYLRFARRLDDSLRALREVLARPGFGEGPSSIGAELELNLIGPDGRPLLLNRAVLADIVDPHMALEVDRFNLEINAAPAPLAGRPFTALAADLERSLLATRGAAARHGGRVATIGILPTLTDDDLRPGVLTDGRRYRALSAGLRRLKQIPFHVRIAGEDEELVIDADDVTLEGANTSFQVHLRVTPEAFARTYNAAQLATAPALAIACNSPTFLGRRLWEETRIALFRQSVDDRIGGETDEWRPARVSFGHGWVRGGAYELFHECVAMHAPLLPILGPEDPLVCVGAGELPKLHELRLHHGTVWRWNRAIYDDGYGGHLRIELRALPAGPTVRDMVANAAFLLGLTLGLAGSAAQMVDRITFGQVRRNFYEAARHGLDAELLWPCDQAPSPRPRRLAELIVDLLPIARAGLVSAGVDADEADERLAVIGARAAAGQTGATWQRATLDALGAQDPHAPATMLARYLDLSTEGSPVHTWPSGRA